MLTVVLVICAVVFMILALGAWTGLAEYVSKTLFGHSAVGTVIRLDQDRVYVRKTNPVVRFETGTGPVELVCDGGWTGLAFLRVGNTYTVRYLRDPLQAVVVDMSEFFQRVVGVVLTSPLALGFTVWAWFRCV